MISTIVLATAATLIGLLYWQPAMEPGYIPSPRGEPTAKEKYIKMIDGLIARGQYRLAREHLEKSSFPKLELPWGRWTSDVSQKINRIEEEARQIDSLRELEKMLGG